MSDRASRRRIRAQSSPRDPATMRFILDAPVQPGRSASFDAATCEAPLAQALFGVGGVTQVQVTGETIMVTRAPDQDWQALKAPIAAAIRGVLDSIDHPLGEAAPTPPAAEDDVTLLTAVKEVLDTRANPSIASHGGRIDVESVENGVARLRMSGGCQGCAASALTLRRGVETMLRTALPALREIVDVTDHASGQNPYYREKPGQSPVFTRQVPVGTLVWEDNELRIDPDYLAPRLGLEAEDLQAGLTRGEIVVETGTASRSGTTRVTVRSAQRTWAADIASDGTAHEVPPARTSSPAGGIPPLPDRVRSYLEDLPPEELPITYGRLARRLGMFAPGAIRKITAALETTMREDSKANHPFIAARVVSRAHGQLPGEGFFELADALGRGQQSSESRQVFHQRLLRESVGPGQRAAFDRIHPST